MPLTSSAARRAPRDVPAGTLTPFALRDTLEIEDGAGVIAIAVCVDRIHEDVEREQR